MERRLAAIFAADMVGYSRLMEADETGTIQRQKAHFAELILPTIEKFNGRIVKLMGDGLLCEFSSVVDAVQCAVTVQRAMVGREADMPEDRRIRYRVGINLGDIVIDAGDIFGHGVNVAARLESMAPPGGVVISGAAYDMLKSNVDVGYEPLGEVQVKNIEEPVRAYRVVTEENGVAPAAMAPKPRRSPLSLVAAAGVVAVALIAGGAWWMTRPDFEPVDVGDMDYALPDKPSIAVLPFENLGGDVSVEAFARGITQDITTDLSKFRDLMVISANSTAVYEDKPITARQAAKELGVRYVLEGSIQRAGDDVRINAQFVDAISGEHVWAERFDRKMTDFFEVQNEISKTIVGLLGAHEGVIAETGRTRAKQKEPGDLNAYELVILARETRNRFNKEDNRKALDMLERALALDPQYVRTHLGLAWTHYQDAQNGWVEDREASTRKAIASAEKAVELDSSSAEPYWVLSQIYMWLTRQPEEGVEAFRKAIELNPNNADILAGWGGWMLPSLGRAEEGIEAVRQAMRLSPFHADWYDQGLQYAYFAAGKYNEAIAAHENIRYPILSSQLHYIAALALAGKQDEAKREAGLLLERRSEFSVDGYAEDPSFASVAADHAERLLGGLRKAGLPDVARADLSKMSFTLPEKPSIAVLPFANLGGDASAEVFADGITQDIITDLSKFRDLMVISANSTFTYKGKPTKVQQVAEELGVRYVLEGSIQRAGDDVRINAQFIDAISGEHVWAERFDRKMTDFFAVQDEISRTIVGLLGAHEGVIAETDRTLAKQKEPADLNAYELVILARETRNRFNKEDNRKALDMLERALALDPQYVRTHLGLAWTHFQDATNGWVEDRARSGNLALEAAKKAVELDPNFGEGYFALGSIYLFVLGDREAGVAEFERSLEINPNNADTLALWGGWVLPPLGRVDEGIETVLDAMRLNPSHDDWYEQGLQAAYFAAERYDEAMKTYRDIEHPIVSAQLVQIASLGLAGKLDVARSEVQQFLAQQPEFSVEGYAQDPGLNSMGEDYKARVLAGLRTAGIPEKPPAKKQAKPRVAVLPFDNFGGEDWFVDGLVEDVITRLARFDDLAVISRSSSFRHKGKPDDVRKIGAELGADYVLEGSVRRGGSKVRVTAQLVETQSGSHVWAADYSAALNTDEIFAVQDKIALNITAAIAGKAGEIFRNEAIARGRNEGATFDGYGCVLLAREVHRTFAAKTHAEATECLERAVVEAGGYADAWAELAWMRNYEVTYGLNPKPDSAKRSLDAAMKATKNGPKNANAFGALAGAWFMNRNRDRAVRATRKAVALNPNDSGNIGIMGFYLVHLSEFEEGKTLLDNAMEVTPYPYPGFYYGRFHYHYQTGDFEAAYQATQELDALPDAYWQYLFGAVALVELGRVEEAQAQIEKARTIQPDLEGIVKYVPDIWWWALPDKGSGYVAAMKKAGLDISGG